MSEHQPHTGAPAQPEGHHAPEHHVKKDASPSSLSLLAIAFAALLILFNQWQILSISGMLSPSTGHAVQGLSVPHASIQGASSVDLSSVDVSSIHSTPQALAAVFPELSDGSVTSADDAIKTLIPTGKPLYGDALGITYDDPVGGLNRLARQLYPALSADLKQNDPQTWQRYLALATQPVGISCEFCCGVGPVGVTATGQLRCGCAHNPAIQALTMGLMKYTDMTDAQILREVMKWKTLWFPKNMVTIALQISGGDPSVLKDVPGMVGGC